MAPQMIDLPGHALERHREKGLLAVSDMGVIDR
jgi:hypothetical protein